MARSTGWAMMLIALGGASVAWADLAQYQSAVTGEASLVGYYTFDAGDGADSRGGHNGSLNGAPGFVSGIGGAGQALELNGSNWVGCGPVADYAFPSNAGTIEAWVSPTQWGCVAALRDANAGGDPSRYACYAEPGWGMNVYSGGDSGGGWVGGGWSWTPYNFQLGTWYHVAYVFEIDTISGLGALRFYVNGQLTETLYEWGDPPHHNLGPTTGIDGIPAQFQIGSSGSVGAIEAYAGRIDEVAVYSTALSSAQIAAHYSAASPLTLTPATLELRTPDLAGPEDFTLTLPAPAGAGGKAVKLTYDDAVLQVADAAMTVIPTGGSVVVPTGQASVVLKVTALIPGTATLIASGDGLADAASVITVDALTLTVAPETTVFTYPDDLGPFDVTLGLAGYTAPAGGVTLTLTYTENKAAVTDAVGTAIPSGGTVTVPAGQSSVVVKVTGRSGGTSYLHVANPAYYPVDGTLEGRFPPSTQALVYQSTIKREPSLLGYYPFDDATANDQKPAGALAMFNGTLMNNPTFAWQDQGGRAVNIDGTQFISFGAVPEFAFPTDGSGTIEAWVWIAPGTGGGCLASVRDGSGARYSLYVYVDAFVVYSGPCWNAAIYPTEMVMPTATWHHVAFVFPGQGVDNQFFLDGVEVPISYYADWSAQPMSLGPATGAAFDVGSSFPWLAEQFTGRIDDLAIYSDALTIDQLHRHLAATQCPIPFSDTDHDGDTDQADFGRFQECFTGAAGGVLPGCECFDRDGIGGVDSSDLAAFLKCAATSGPNIPVEVDCDLN